MSSIHNCLPKDKIKTLSFKEFYDLTGVDLVLTGTNITQHSPRYFSVYHIPDFPVIEAVQISMTLPGAFRPVYVNTDVRKGDEEQRKRYAGLYVDGGMLNNYPIHAFDNIETTDCTDDIEGQHLCDLSYYGIKGAFPIAGNPRLRNSECDCVLGMRLQDGETSDINTEEKSIYPKDDWVFINYFKNLIGTLMYGSEEGQIINIAEEMRTVEFYATINADENPELLRKLSRELKNLSSDLKSFSLLVSDFSTPAIDKNVFRNRRALAEIKELLIREAGKKMDHIPALVVSFRLPD